MYEMIQENWLLVLAFPALFSLVMGVLLKFVNEKKLLKMTKPPTGLAAVAFSRILIRQLGPKAAAKLENGLIITLCKVVRLTIQHFEEKLIADNPIKK